jgi:hypothetical protein
MLADLMALLSVTASAATYEDYEQAILGKNVLGKRTASTRLWAWKKLRELYALDPRVPVFRLLRRLWDAEAAARPVLALLAAMARDALLRSSTDAITAATIGQPVTKNDFRQLVIRARGERFSESTMEAILSHLVSSWTESGYLSGREKERFHPTVTPAATAYALALGYLAGARGALLFSTLWTSVLDTPETTLHDHAREASRRGWLTYRGIGKVVEITFERLLTSDELRELAVAQ